VASENEKGKKRKMKEFWIEYRGIVFPVVFFSFGILWLTLNFYIWECYKMSEYKSQIDESGKITSSRIEFPFLNPLMVFYLFTFIPSIKAHPEYYKFKTFEDQIQIIKSFRKFYGVVFPIYILGLIPLILFLDKLYH
jgi:hypothetical protein